MMEVSLMQSPWGCLVSRFLGGAAAPRPAPVGYLVFIAL